MYTAGDYQIREFGILHFCKQDNITVKYFFGSITPETYLIRLRKSYLKFPALSLYWALSVG